MNHTSSMSPASEPQTRPARAERPADPSAASPRLPPCSSPGSPQLRSAREPTPHLRTPQQSLRVWPPPGAHQSGTRCSRLPPSSRHVGAASEGPRSHQDHTGASSPPLTGVPVSVTPNPYKLGTQGTRRAPGRACSGLGACVGHHFPVTLLPSNQQEVPESGVAQKGSPGSSPH